MDNKELLQQALEALTFCGDAEHAFDKEEAAAEALRARLAQPDPEPVAWGVIQRGKGVWFVNDSRFAAQHYANHYSHRDAAGFDQKVVPLYTAPPQPKTEPVAWVEAEFWEHLNRVNCATAYKMPGSGRQPLYTNQHSATHSADSAESFGKAEPESIGDLYAHRLAFMLECAVLDPTGTWEAAHELLDEYRAAVRREHEAAGEPYVSAFGKD